MSDEHTISSRSKPFLCEVIGTARLAFYMLKKMRKHRKKAHWRTVTNEYLFTRLCDEAEELANELMVDKPSAKSIILECADIANFCMMIADKARKDKTWMTNIS